VIDKITRGLLTGLILVVIHLEPASSAMAAGLVLGPGEFVQAGGIDIAVPGFSVPSFVDWDEDGLEDLVIGEGPDPSSGLGKVRVYLNVGTTGNPVFSSYFYVQAGGADLTSWGGG
jgi:hypothetical protein